MKKGNIFTKIVSAFKKKTIELITLPNSGFSGGLEDIFDSYNLKTFRESLYLFIGVSMIRDTVSGIPLDMYQIKNKDGDTEELHDDPFLDVLERPNKTQTQKEFWKLSIAYYLLAGEAFWYLERDSETDIPTAMINMRPDAVDVLFAEDKTTILGYVFNTQKGTQVKLQTFEVLHIKNIDPLNPGRGIGVVRPATQRIITEKEASLHQANTFRNQGRPDIAVFSENELDQEQIDEAREKWAKTFGGDKGSQVAFFGAGTKSMQVLNTNPKEMDFINSQNFLRDDILAVLRIPKAMLTSDDVNLANSQTARINYIKEACQPVLDVFVDVINNRLLNDMDEDRFVTYDSPVNEDREVLLKEAKELKEAGIITINEARDLMNYESVEDGDVLAANTNPFATMSFKQRAKNVRIKALALRTLKKRTILVRKFKAIEATAKLIERQKEVKRSRNAVFATREEKNKYIKAFNDNIDNKTETFLKHIDVYNDGFLKRIKDHMEKFGAQATSFFDPATEIRTMREIFEPLMITMFGKSGQETLNGVEKGFAVKASEHFHTPEALIASIKARQEFFSRSMLNTDFDEMSEIIAEALKNGDGVDAIGRSLRQYFDDMSVARGKTIARTETGRLVSQATNEAYNQSEVITGKVWLTAGDGKVRPEHQANSDVIVDTNGVFPSGEHYPGELSINCRCALAPAV